MPKRYTVQSVVVHRDGKTFTVKPGTVFNYTGEELADIEAANPDAVRIPVNEDSNAPQESEEARKQREQAEADAHAAEIAENKRKADEKQVAEANAAALADKAKADAAKGKGGKTGSASDL